MGRHARPDPDEGWHHVMNRGAGRRNIFRHGGDARRFLDLVGQSHYLYGVEVHAYCLMPNHFHLLVHCPTGGLSDFMHRIGSIYTRAINEDIASDGAIFRGRFRSILCVEPGYVDNVGRYIHRNPLELEPGKPLSEWKRSSYRAYLGLEVSPAWLKTSTLLEWHGGRDGFRRFVEGEVVAERQIVDSEAWRWAINTAIVESDVTEGATQQLHRSLTLAIADRSDELTKRALLATLHLPNNKARNSALSRARVRMSSYPELRQIADRATVLATAFAGSPDTVCA